MWTQTETKNLPRKGWHCNYVEDLGEASGSCEMCGKEEIRYLHHLHHEDIAQPEIIVGCVCAGHLEQDYEAPKRRERELRNKAAKEQRAKKQKEADEREEREQMAWRCKRAAVCGNSRHFPYDFAAGTFYDDLGDVDNYWRIRKNGGVWIQTEVRGRLVKIFISPSQFAENRWYYSFDSFPIPANRGSYTTIGATIDAAYEALHGA